MSSPTPRLPLPPVASPQTDPDRVEAGPTRRVLVLRFAVVWALLIIPALFAVASTRLAERPGPPETGPATPLRLAPACPEGVATC